MKRNMIAIILIVLMIISTTTACRTPEATGVQSSQTISETSKVIEDIFAPFAKYDETVTFTAGIWTGDYSALPQGDTVENNEFTRYIEDKVNVKMVVDWEVDNSAYAQKVAFTISSGEIPDVLKVDERTLKQLVDADLIQDLTEVYEKTLSPFLKEQYDSYNGRILPTATFDGKLMALPGTQIGGQHNMLWVRQDWLDKLQMDAPRTLDDIVLIAKAFIEEDPDGNNENDTIGIPVAANVAGTYNSFNGLDTIFSLYDAYPRQWLKDETGKVFYGSTAPEMKTALIKIKELYDSGIIDKQFAVRKQGEDAGALIAAGKCGLVFGPWWGPYWPLSDSVKNNPDAEWIPYVAPLDSAGKLKIYTQNPNNMNLVIRKGYENPEAVIKVLNVENQVRRGMDPDALEMIAKNAGRAGYWPIDLQIDYEDAVLRGFTMLKEAIDSGSTSNLRFDRIVTYEAYNKNEEHPGADVSQWAEATAWYHGAALTAVDQILTRDPVFFGQTETMEMKWATLDKLESEIILKIIMGEEPIDKYDDFVDQWNQLGGGQIIGEITEAIKK